MRRYEMPVMSTDSRVSAGVTDSHTQDLLAASKSAGAPAPSLMRVGSSQTAWNIESSQMYADSTILVVEISSLERAVELMCIRKLRPPLPLGLPKGKG